MTIVILDRQVGGPPPYADWLADAGEDLVLVTGRSVADATGYAEVRFLPGYPTGAELAVLDIAAAATVSALVAIATPDLVRAGALRDHLGIDGQRRADAVVHADPVAMRAHLQDTGVPTIPAGPVLRVSDLYWYRHRWGGPVRVRRRDEQGWPTVAVLRDDADLRAFTADGLAPSLISVPSLFAEPDLAGSRSSTVDGPYRTTVLHADQPLVDTVDFADPRAAVRWQAGLSSQEVTRWAS